MPEADPIVARCGSATPHRAHVYARPNGRPAFCVGNVDVIVETGATLTPAPAGEDDIAFSDAQLAFIRGWARD